MPRYAHARFTCPECDREATVFVREAERWGECSGCGHELVDGDADAVAWIHDEGWRWKVSMAGKEYEVRFIGHDSLVWREAKFYPVDRETELRLDDLLEAMKRREFLLHESRR